jgi:hypothetical protein
METLIQRCGLMASNGMTDAEIAAHFVENGICSPQEVFLALVASRLLVKWDEQSAASIEEKFGHGDNVGHGWWR